MGTTRRSLVTAWWVYLCSVYNVHHSVCTHPLLPPPSPLVHSDLPLRACALTMCVQSRTHVPAVFEGPTWAMLAAHLLWTPAPTLWHLP